MKASVKKLLDELNSLSSDRYMWEAYWRDCTKYALPQTEQYENAFSTGGWEAVSHNMMSQPVAHKKTRDLYDQTSLWAIERLSAGLISLKTPESAMWHNLGVDDVLGYDTTHNEQVWLEKVRDFLFAVRSNPRTGFWTNHKAAVRSVCAYGDGFLYVEEMMGGGPSSPWRYEFCPLYECYTGVDNYGNLDRMFRVFRRTPAQIIARWGEEAAGKELVADAKDEKKKHMPVAVLHAVRPRDEGDRRGKLGVKGGAFASHYVLIKQERELSEGGYYEMPYIRHAWSSTGARPYSEGPMALALAEVKSLNKLAMHELIAAQQNVQPPTATFGDAYTRLNLNPGANNPGMVSREGRLLAQPIITAARPDFAQTVLEARRNTVREMLYLNLWQVLIQNADQTATEALLRMQEKGELLGPVGISLNRGLSDMTDREIGILARKGAFEKGAVLEIPESLIDKDISPVFTSPLDRLRKSEEMIGAQRLVEGLSMLAQAKQDPSILERVDSDEYADLLQDGFGAPKSLLRDRAEVEKAGQQGKEMQSAMAQLEMLKQGGEAAQAAGAGAVAMEQGAQSMQNGPLASVMEAMANQGQAA